MLPGALSANCNFTTNGMFFLFFPTCPGAIYEIPIAEVSQIHYTIR